jgi:TonB-linked SusC/RagA family outer membrane protein
MRKLILFFGLAIVAQIVAAQERQLSGIITDKVDGLPLAGVNITLKDSPGTGTISDVNGNYSIKAVEGKIIVFTYIGYETQEKKITGAGVLNIVMHPTVTMLQEVVAIGYGTVKKSDLTGSITSVKGDLLQKTPASGLDQALQGRAAGVTVNANSGQPGAAAEVRIRGIGTVNDSAPIYVVDGLIVSDISFLSPNDIESTEILKDASSTAIYGSRGANGVILISTKKGKEGKGNISFNSYVGFQNRWKQLDLMKRDEFASTIVLLNNVASEMVYYSQNGFSKWLSNYRLGTSPYYPTVYSSTNPNGLDYSNIETDWQSEVFNRNATVQNYHFLIDGSNEKIRYALSASYFNQNGIIIGSDYERLTLRINTSFKVRSWLTIGENLSFVSSGGRNAMNNNVSPDASILSAALAMAPWDPTHYPQGSANLAGKDLSGQIAASSNFRNVTNPFSMVENTEPENKIERWVGDLFVEITPFKNLILRSAISMDLSNNRDKLFKKEYEYSAHDKNNKNFLETKMSRYSTVIFENTLTYSADIGKHSFSAMAGQTAEEFNSYLVGGSGYYILNPSKNNWYLSQTMVKNPPSDKAKRTRMFSLLGRLHYSYNEKYMATLNFRADASSKFPNDLWGFFPSTALAWRISEEEWMKDMSNLDFMKVRLGWGQIGNDKIDPDSFILKMFNEGPTFVDYVLGANQQMISGATVLTYVNKGGKWETTEQWNFGLDFGFFRGLLGGSVDFFVRDTKEMILEVKAPAHVGNRYDALVNVGTVRNQGIELTLDHRHRVGGINYSLGANVSFVKNKLTALNGGNIVYKDRVINDEGYPLYTFWGYEYDGIFSSDQEADEYMYGYPEEANPFSAGDAKFIDRNNDGIIDDGDKTNIGNPFPWLTYGLNIGIDYKGFDLQLFFQGVYGNEIYNALRERTEGQGVSATLGTQMHDVWTKMNPTGTIPNPYGNSMNKETSSRFIESGAYMRLKNVQFGYNIPAGLIQKIQLSRCRVYVTLSNLLTFTGYTGYDPEVGNGVDYGNYPQSRTVTLGLNVDF